PQQVHLGPGEFRIGALFTGVYACLLGPAKIESCQASRSHPAFVNQALRGADVDEAPIACGPARSKADSVRVSIDRVSNPVNPAVSNCFDDRLWPCYACFA